MEVVGGAAAVLQLIQITTESAKGLCSACKHLYNAGKEFRSAEEQVSWIQIHLQTCEYAISQIHPALVTPGIELSITLAVTGANSHLLELQEVCTKIQNVNSLASRVEWVFKNRQRVAAVLGGLERGQKALESAMQPLNL